MNSSSQTRSQCATYTPANTVLGGILVQIYNVRQCYGGFYCIQNPEGSAVESERIPGVGSDLALPN